MCWRPVDHFSILRGPSWLSLLPRRQSRASAAGRCLFLSVPLDTPGPCTPQSCFSPDRPQKCTEASEWQIPRMEINIRSCQSVKQLWKGFGILTFNLRWSSGDALHSELGAADELSPVGGQSDAGGAHGLLALHGQQDGAGGAGLLELLRGVCKDQRNICTVAATHQAEFRLLQIKPLIIGRAFDKAASGLLILVNLYFPPFLFRRSRFWRNWPKSVYLTAALEFNCDRCREKNCKRECHMIEKRQKNGFIRQYGPSCPEAALMLPPLRH